MRDTDLERFGGMIAALARTFNTEADEALLLGYKMGLDDLPIEDIEASVATAMRTCDRLPPVIVLRKLTGESAADDRALVAWSVFQKAVVEHGFYTSVNFDDPVIHAAVRNCGGWLRCCELSGEEFNKWLRKDFLKAYTAFCSTGISREAAAPLIGFHDAGNAMNGYHDHIKPPLLIATGLPAHNNLRRLGGKPSQPAMGIV